MKDYSGQGQGKTIYSLAKKLNGDMKSSPVEKSIKRHTTKKSEVAKKMKAKEWKKGYSAMKERNRKKGVSEE